LVQCI
jgi:hypothetical protein